jgi:ABC-type phosphate transport system substrate-binding protein
MFGNNANLAQALSVTAALAAVLTAMPSAQADVPPGGVPAVSADPLAVLVPQGTPVGTPPLPNFRVSNEAQQFHGLGATFPQIVYRNLFDYYGVTIPQIVSQPGFRLGLQPINPAGSPRLINAQYNYVGTGSDTGRDVFLGTSLIPAAATYTPTNTNVIPPLTVCAPAVIGSTVIGSDGVSIQVPLPCQGAPISYAPGSVSFAGTDLPLTPAEIATYTENQFPTRGNPIQVPTVFGGIAVAYNQTGGPTGNFNLSTADLCKIFNGTFNSYSQLTAPSTTGGATGSIKVVIPDSSETTSGITYGFTSFLAKACPGALGEPFTDYNRNAVRNTNISEPFTDTSGNGVYDLSEPFTDYNGNGVRDALLDEPFTDTNGNGVYNPSSYFLLAGVNAFPVGANAPVPGTGANYVNFIRSSGNTAVTNAIGSTPGGLGYIEASFTNLFQPPSTAIPNPPAAARLQVGGTGSTFVLPLTVNVRAAIASGLTLIPDATYPTTVFTVGGLVSSTPSVIPSAANSYPITVPTYILLYSKYSTGGVPDPDGAGPALASPANPNAAAALTGFFGNGFLLGNRTNGIGSNDQLVQQIGFSLPSNPFRLTLRTTVGTITQVP